MMGYLGKFCGTVANSSFANMSVVALNRCTGYGDSDYIISSVRQCLSMLAGLENIFRPKAKVLLKPNLLSSRRGPEEPCNTHPALMRALAVILQQDYSCRVFIGDSSGGLSYGGTKNAFIVSGLSRIAAELGIELIDFDISGVKQIGRNRARYLTGLNISKFLDEVEVIVSVPKLKTHSLMLFTGAVKNMMGVVPGSGKRGMHAEAPRPQQLGEYLVELFAVVKPQLAVMDAVVAMQGNGPAAGTPYPLGLILASTDAVALDAVASRVIGLDPFEVATTKLAARYGLGIADLNQIEIRGLLLADVLVKDFQLPLSGIRDKVINLLPNFVIKRLVDLMSQGRPVVTHSKCIRCNSCIQACPVAVMSYNRNKEIIIDYKRCIECYCCHELCPLNAITIRMPYAAHCLIRIESILKRLIKLFSFPEGSIHSSKIIRSG